VVLTGFMRSNFDVVKPFNFFWKPLLTQLQYNTAEGFLFDVSPVFQQTFILSHTRIRFMPHVRYGFSNAHFNAWGSLQLDKNFSAYANEDDEYNSNTWTFSGGKRVSQFNKQNPITPLSNSFNTLFLNQNYMKTYENYFGEINYSNKHDNGFIYTLDVLYEDRYPLNNTTTFAFIKYHPQKFTPNYPAEILSSQFPRHRAMLASATLQYQPGQRFIQFPHHKVSLGSKYPTFQAAYTKAIEGIFGSNENFDKWNFSVFDDANLKLLGMFTYRVDVGGFLNNKKVYVQDYQHFAGNKSFFVFDYDNVFLNAFYYANSNDAHFLQMHISIIISMDLSQTSCRCCVN